MLAKFKRLNYHHLLPDLAIIAFSLYASLYLRLGWQEFSVEVPILNSYILLFLLLRMSTFTVLGVYDIIWRYVSLSDALKVGRAVLVSTMVLLATSYMVDIGRLPRATFVIDMLLVTMMLGGIRFARRFAFEYSFGLHIARTGRKTVIYGAGNTGRLLATRFSTDRVSGFKLLGFVDDDPQKVGRVIAGNKVLGTRRQLADILRDYRVDELIIAISKPTPEALREVVQVTGGIGIKPRLITGFSHGGGKTTNAFRSIELSDLLNRPPKNIDVTAVKQLVENRRVLVTGAGGTIGGELARQILGFRPRSLLLLDHSEFNLYGIDQELRVAGSNEGSVVPLLVDIKDMPTLENVFKEHSPEIVFHAAAYKHVHLVEGNPVPAILNNVMGTRNVLELSELHGVDTFVLISTDKAVNPVGVMGATKRICELMVADAGRELGKRYCAVRFGNVLGSSGSLIPLLKGQIERGEPVTITHREMTRYFMLIPEAVSLVLKAATIAEAGDITLLNMGEPVKIVDVAKSLIALMGKSEEEVGFVFTGLRPGEKLFEELYTSGDELKTSDPDILVVPRGERMGLERLGFRSVEEAVERIISLARKGSLEALSPMRSLVMSSFASASPASAPPEAPGDSAFLGPGGERHAPNRPEPRH